MEKHPLHLKNQGFHFSNEVELAVKSEYLARRHTHDESGLPGSFSEHLPNDPAQRIATYMKIFEQTVLHPDAETRKANIDSIRDTIYDMYIIDREHFPESYFELQRRIAREQGYGAFEITPEIREQMIDTAIEDQKHSLNAWIDYLTSDDAMYPSWFKYYVWTQITTLSQFDKERGEFKKRTRSTVAPFPDIYREPLARICDIYQGYPALLEQNESELAKLRIKKKMLTKELQHTAEAEKRDTIEHAIEDIDNRMSELSAPLQSLNKKFSSLYAELIQESLAASLERREEVRGEWVRYEQGDPDAAGRLYQSLSNKGTGWCTAGLATAEFQIRSGDFYVYYTYDPQGNPTQPRLAVRMDGHMDIAEVRGILPGQHVEPIMQGVLNEKLKDFGKGADVYRKKSDDMRRLTALEVKHEKGEMFTKQDLEFLYELNAPIQSFGYGNDPRIEELRAQRDIEEDYHIVFPDREEIAQKLIHGMPYTQEELWNFYGIGCSFGAFFPMCQRGIENVHQGRLLAAQETGSENLSEQEACSIMGDLFCGADAIERVFGFSPQEIPPIPYSKHQLRQAVERGEHLVLRISADKDGNPLTARHLDTIKNNKMGKLLYDTKWYARESFFTTDIPRTEWKLVGKLLESSLSKNYVQQTGVLRDDLKSCDTYLDTIEQETATDEVLRTLCTRMGVDYESGDIINHDAYQANWKDVARALSQLPINRNHRRTFVEVLYDQLVMSRTIGAYPDLTGTYDWTSSLSSDGGLVLCGYFGAEGADVGRWEPVVRSGPLGVVSVR